MKINRGSAVLFTLIGLAIASCIGLKVSFVDTTPAAIASNEQIYDFYWSEKQAQAQEEKELGSCYTRALYQGIQFTVQVQSGSNPPAEWSDVVLIGTGTAADVTYANEPAQ